MYKPVSANIGCFVFIALIDMMMYNPVVLVGMMMYNPVFPNCCVFRALVGMMMYNPETTEIAKPSELLNGVRAYMNVLQGLENYG